MILIDRITKTEIAMRDVFKEVRIVRKRVKQARDDQSRKVYQGRLNRLMAMLKR